LLYVATLGDKAFAVIDGVATEPRDAIRMLSAPFSPNGRRVAFLTSRNERAFLNVDNWESEGFDGFFQMAPIFSPDSRRIAIAAMQGETWLALVDGVPGKPFDRIRPPVFSPDSKSIAYRGLRDKDNYFVVDDTLIGPYSGFFGQSRCEFDSNTTLHFLANKENDIYRVEVTIQRND
jgi:Tol biopolymer transport system component